MAIILFACILTGYIFEDSDSLIVVDDTLVICGDHDYAQKVTISDSSMILIRPWLEGSDTLGRLVLRAPRIRVTNASVITGTARGFAGGTNSNPHGSGPGAGGAGNPGGGGGAAYGGDGGQGGDNAPGSGGSSYGSSTDTIIERGSGGGAGRLGNVDGFGGNGGASITLRATSIVIDGSGIESDGVDGETGGIEAGGGGAGGGIMLWADTITMRTASLSASGGNGGNAPWGGGGGAGGGRIKIFHDLAPDTEDVHYQVVGGAAGTGAYGTPGPGSPGSVYIGPILAVHETAGQPVETIHFFPSLTRTTIRARTTRGTACLLLYDCAGRLAKRVPIAERNTRIDLSELNAGVYFLRTARLQKTLGTVIVLE